MHSLLRRQLTRFFPDGRVPADLQPMLEAIGLMPTAGIFMTRFSGDTLGRTLALKRKMLGIAPAAPVKSTRN